MDGAALTRAVAAIEASVDMSALADAVRAIAGPAGYDRYVLYAAPPLGDGLVAQLFWIEGDWFGEGQAIAPETYLARCPVNRHVLETDAPFFWTKIGRGDAETYRIVRRPQGPGLHGLQVPVFGRAGLTGAMSFGGTTVDSNLQVRLALTLVATASLSAAQRIAGPRGTDATPRLSSREREVMRWVASGRRQTDIALSLGLSERTIENHLRRIRNRLGAASTAQAVHLLLRHGELEA